MTRLVLGFLVCVLLAGCASVPADVDIATTPESIVLEVTGAEEMVPLLTDLARFYMDEHSGTTIDVTGGGTRWGVRAVMSGAADIGMSARSLSEQEQEQLSEYPIAQDAVAVIVHPSNPVASLSQDDLGAIFSGDTFRWNAFGWDEREITVVTRETGSGDRDAFESFVLDRQELTLNALIAPTPAAVVETVAETPSAIGYVGLAQVSGTVKVIAVESVHPSEQTIADQTYPLARPFLLVTTGRARRATRNFINWVRSDAGQAIVERDFVPIQ